MKCANCNAPALYVYEGAGIRATGYCNSHLPRFLEGKAKSGSLKTTAAYDREVQSALAALAPIQGYAVDPEPQQEPAPTQKKRRTKSKPVPAPAQEPSEIIEAEPEPVEEPAEG